MLTIQQLLQHLKQPLFASSSSSSSLNRQKRRRTNPLEGVTAENIQRYRTCFLLGIIYLLGMLVWVISSYRLVFPQGEQHWSTKYSQQTVYNSQHHTQHQALRPVVSVSSSGLAESSVHRAIVNDPNSGLSLNALGGDRYSTYVRPRANRYVPGWEALVPGQKSKPQVQRTIGDDDDENVRSS